MKRAPFLGGAAALLAGCGGRHALQALPGVAPMSGAPASSGNVQLVPAVAEAIPRNVLLAPIFGETRRFDGAVAPPGWALAKGQTLPIASNERLFSVLKTIAGGDGKTTFKLPLLPRSIIAVSGQLPATPSMLQALGRDLSLRASLGPGAVAAPLRVEIASRGAAEQRRLPMQVPYRGGAARPLDVSTATQIRSAGAAARVAVLAALTPSSGARFENASAAFLAGRTALSDAVTDVASSLSVSEAGAILDAHATMRRAFGTAVPAPRDAQLEASRFLFSVGVTQEQIASATSAGVELR